MDPRTTRTLCPLPQVSHSPAPERASALRRKATLQILDITIDLNEIFVRTHPLPLHHDERGGIMHVMTSTKDSDVKASSYRTSARSASPLTSMHTAVNSAVSTDSSLSNGLTDCELKALGKAWVRISS